MNHQLPPSPSGKSKYAIIENYTNHPSMFLSSPSKSLEELIARTRKNIKTVGNVTIIRQRTEAKKQDDHDSTTSTTLVSNHSDRRV